MKILQIVLPLAAFAAIMLIPDEIDRFLGFIAYMTVFLMYVFVAISNMNEEMRELKKKYEKLLSEPENSLA